MCFFTSYAKYAKLYNTIASIVKYLIMNSDHFRKEVIYNHYLSESSSQRIVVDDLSAGNSQSKLIEKNGWGEEFIQVKKRL